MINQARLVNRTPVNVEENRASPVGSMIPQIATRPVKVSAMSSNEFLNTVSPFYYIKEIININYIHQKLDAQNLMFLDCAITDKKRKKFSF